MIKFEKKMILVDLVWIKTASLAHCDVLTVIQKKMGISHRKVDADHIFETDKLNI